MNWFFSSILTIFPQRIKFGMFYDYVGRWVNELKFYIGNFIYILRHFKYIATGHYAQVQHADTEGGKSLLLTSQDEFKDQVWNWI